MRQGRVAIEHLEEKPMNDRERRQHAFAPDMADSFAGRGDVRLVEVEVNVLPNLPQRGINPSMHRQGLLSHGSCGNAMVAEALVFLKSPRSFGLSLA